MPVVKILLCACLLLLSQTGNAIPFFQVRYSKPLAVYLFVESLSESGREGNAFQKRYKSSRFDNTETQRALADFDTLERNYSYAFEHYPQFSKIDGQTDALLRRALLLAHDLNDFQHHAAGILPKEDFARLLQMLSVFTPVYDTLIYAPLQKNFEEQLALCRQKLNTGAVTDFFQKMSRFHGIPDVAGADDTFFVAFYPLPKSNGFQATAFIDCSVSALPEEERDYDLLLSITLHEIAHILYDSESLQLKEKVQAAFRRDPHPGAWNAYLLLNEAQATALGNGAAYKALHGSLDTGSWYNNKYRNDMAKAIYPMVADYLSQGKTIDEAFVAEYCRLYATRFPNWEAEAAHLFTNRFVIADDYKNIQQLSRYFPNTSYSHAATPFDKPNLEKARRTSLNKVLLFSEGDTKQLLLAKSVFPELKVSPGDLRKGFARYQLPDHTWLYAIFANKRPLEETLQQLASQ